MFQKQGIFNQNWIRNWWSSFAVNIIALLLWCLTQIHIVGFPRYVLSVRGKSCILQRMAASLKFTGLFPHTLLPSYCLHNPKILFYNNLFFDFQWTTVMQVMKMNHKYLKQSNKISITSNLFFHFKKLKVQKTYSYQIQEKLK